MLRQDTRHHELMLRSKDGRNWFSDPKDLLAYERRRKQQEAKLKAELQAWFASRFERT